MVLRCALWHEHAFRLFKECPVLLLHIKNNPFLDRIGTRHRIWLLRKNRRLSGQWLCRDEAPKSLTKPKPHEKKFILTV